MASKKEPVYQPLTEKDFKLNKKFLVRDPINGTVSQYTPKGNLAAQAVKFGGLVARQLAVIEEKQAASEKGNS